MSGIHSCSYFCTRPACVAVQRDELRDRSVVDDSVRRAAVNVIAAWDKHGTAPALRSWIDILRDRLAEPVAVQAEPVDKALTNAEPQVDKEQAEPVAVQAEPVSTEPIATVYRNADTLLCEFGESNAAM